MVDKTILRGLSRITVVVIIAICALCLPSSYNGWVTGFVGCIIVDIYEKLIEKGKI